MCPPNPERPAPPTPDPPSAHQATPTPLPPRLSPGQPPAARRDGALSPPRIPGVELIEAIGRGGFAIVYRAHQHSVDRDVAVKIEQFQLTDDRDRRRFEREIMAAGRVSAHPHIVSLFDGGLTSDRRPYLVMELCPGGSLANRMSESGPLPAAEVIDVGIGISDALQAAHNAGILHRDVKPANILITQYGTPALTDFGVAALPREVTMHSMTLASLTPSYAPPEAFDLKPPTPSADVYALGATLYALLRGSPPRWTDTGPPALPVLMEQIRHPLPELPDVHPDLMRVIWAATAPNPADRWASAADLCQALRQLRAGNSPLCPPGGIPSNPSSAAPAPAELGQGQATPNTAQTRPGAAGGSAASPAGAGPDVWQQRQHAAVGPGSPWSPQNPPAGSSGGSNAPSAPGYPVAGGAAMPTDVYTPPPPGPAPITDYSPGPVPSTRPPRRRVRWVAAAALVAVVAGAGGYFVWQGTRPNPIVEPTAATQAAQTPVSMPEKTGSYKEAGKNECWKGLVNIAGSQTANSVESCDVEHNWETYAEGDLSEETDGVNIDVVERDPVVMETCTKEKLQQYVGSEVDSYDQEIIPPSEARFLSGERRFYCVAHKTGAGVVTGSFKDGG